MERVRWHYVLSLFLAFQVVSQLPYTRFLFHCSFGCLGVSTVYLCVVDGKNSNIPHPFTEDREDNFIEVDSRAPFIYIYIYSLDRRHTNIVVRLSDKPALYHRKGTARRRSYSLQNGEGWQTLVSYWDKQGIPGRDRDRLLHHTLSKIGRIPIGEQEAQAMDGQITNKGIARTPISHRNQIGSQGISE